MKFNWNNSILFLNDKFTATCERPTQEKVLVRFYTQCSPYGYFDRMEFFLEICSHGVVIPTNSDWTRRCNSVKELFKELSDDPITQISYVIAIRHMIRLNGYPDLYGDILLDNIKN